MVQSDQASKTTKTSVSMGETVINFEMDTAIQTALPRLVLIFDKKGNISGMSWVPVIPPLAPVMSNIPRDKAAHWAICKSLGASMLEEPEDRSPCIGNEYESEDHTSEVELEEEDLILNPSL